MVLIIAKFFFAESIGRGGSREVSQMKKQNVRLTEENNLLKLKLEILLDMVKLSLL